MIHFQQTALTVSPICLGTVHYGTKTSAQDAMEQMDIFLESGGNFIDTAHVYGDWGNQGPGLSERIIGNWIKTGGHRQKVVLVTKGAHPFLGTNQSRVDKKNIQEDIDSSLQCLQTDHIDLYFLHRDRPEMPVEEILPVLEDNCKQGKIRYYGCSNWGLSRIKAAKAFADSAGFTGFVCNQLMWSLPDINPAGLGDSTMLSMDEETFAYHREENLNTMAYTSIAKGYFSRLHAGTPPSDELKRQYENPTNNKLYQLLSAQLPQGYTMMDLCLLYFQQQPFAVVPIVSFSSRQQLTQAMEGVYKPYPEILNKAAALKVFIHTSV